MSIILLNKELIEVQKTSSKEVLMAKNKAQAVDILLKLSSTLKLSTASQVDEVTRTVITITDDSE